MSQHCDICGDSEIVTRLAPHSTSAGTLLLLCEDCAALIDADEIRRREAST